MKSEKWRKVPGLPVEASTLGRLTIKGKVKKGTLYNNGYFAVQFFYDRIRYRFLVHRLVCMAFHGMPPTPNHEVAHNDGNRLNNVPENLRWATRKENMHDKFLHGTSSIGSKNGASKLSEDVVLSIRRKHSKGVSVTKLSAEYGVNYTTVRSIVLGLAWKHVA